MAMNGAHMISEPTEIDGFFDRLGCKPGDTLVATQTDVATGVARGLWLTADRDATGRQVQIELTQWRMTPDEGSVEEPVLVMTLVTDRAGDRYRLRNLRLDQEAFDVSDEALQGILSDLSMIASVLRQRRVPDLIRLRTRIASPPSRS